MFAGDSITSSVTNVEIFLVTFDCLALIGCGLSFLLKASESTAACFSPSLAFIIKNENKKLLHTVELIWRISVLCCILLMILVSCTTRLEDTGYCLLLMCVHVAAITINFMTLHVAILGVEYSSKESPALRKKSQDMLLNI